MPKEKPQSRVLIIGDIHEPFSHKDYLQFCKDTYKEYKCNQVVFIGDIIDQHFSSFHTMDPDGFGAGEELERAVSKIKEWNQAFPVATVILGNHDRIIMRKAFEGGIPKIWVKDFKEVLQTPKWAYVFDKTIDDVYYVHGEGGTARTRIKTEAKSIVQGHLHSQAYIEWNNNQHFGMQVGCGIDDTQYAFAYAKAGKKSILSCGVVLHGKQPILVKM